MHLFIVFPNEQGTKESFSIRLLIELKDALPRNDKSWVILSFDSISPLSLTEYWEVRP